MKNKYIGIVFRKEMLDMFRDRKTIITTLLLPVVLYPLMFLLMGSAIDNMVAGQEDPLNISILYSAAGQEQSAGSEELRTMMRDILSPNPNAQIIESDDPVAALDKGDVNIVLRAVLVDGALHAEIIYNDTKNSSTSAVDQLNSLLSLYNQNAIDRYLAEQGIDLASIQPIPSITYQTLTQATGEGTGSNAGMMLGMLIPMLVVVLLSVGGMATASDLFAGEKERKTMEPLLCTRAGRSSILSGKFIAVTVFAIMSVVASVAGLVVAYFINPEALTMSNMLGETVKLELPFFAAILTLILVALLAMVFSGLHVVIATYARTSKESATYGSFVMLISYIPAFATMFMGAGDMESWMMFVPLLNVVGSLKMILAGLTDYVFLAGSIGVSLVFLLAVMALARWLFNKETIMLRTA